MAEEADFDASGPADAGEELAENNERYVPRGQFPSTMSNFPTQAMLKREDRYEPSGWWETRDHHRPWKEKPDLRRQNSVAPEQSERWARTRKVRPACLSDERHI